MAEEDALIHFDAWSKEQKRAEDCERKSQENREENESHTRGNVTRLQRQVLTVEKQRLKSAAVCRRTGHYRTRTPGPYTGLC